MKKYLALLTVGLSLIVSTAETNPLREASFKADEVSRLLQEYGREMTPQELAGVNKHLSKALEILDAQNVPFPNSLRIETIVAATNSMVSNYNSFRNFLLSGRCRENLIDRQVEHGFATRYEDCAQVFTDKTGQELSVIYRLSHILDLQNTNFKRLITIEVPFNRKALITEGHASALQFQQSCIAASEKTKTSPAVRGASYLATSCKFNGFDKSKQIYSGTALIHFAK